jgi:hypothetical protein
VIACSLPPLIEMHASKYDDGLDDYYYDDDDIDLLYSYDCLLECSSYRLRLYSCIINMAKIFKVKY